MRRRVIIITYPYSLGISGGGVQDCLQTARHLSAAGAEVMLLPVNALPISKFRIPRPSISDHISSQQQKAELEAKGVRVITVSPNPIYHLLDGLPIRKAVNDVLSHTKVDAVLGFWQEAAFLPPVLRSENVVFGMIAAAPYSMWFDRQDLSVSALISEKRWQRSKFSFLRSLVYRSLFRNTLMQAVKSIPRRFWLERPLKQADIIFTRSNFTREELINLFNIDHNRITVSYCGIDPLFGQIERPVGTEVSRFIYYGALIAEKGIFDVIEALANVADKGWRNWSLKIAGWGDEERVRRQARERGVEDKIEFLGRLDHPALAHELKWAHVAFLPSYAESFGLAIAEAQAAGLPVIAYRAGAVPEVIEHNNTGWLVPRGHVELLARAVIEAMQNPERTFRLGLAGRERTIRLFSWEKTAETTLSAIERVAAIKPHHGRGRN